MNEFKIDESGELEFGYFFELRIPLDIEFEYQQFPADWICASGIHGDGVVYASVSRTGKAIYGCESNPSHRTGYEIAGYSANLHGGDKLHEFVHDMTMLNVLATTEFAERVSTSGLIGIELCSLNIDMNQSRESTPSLTILRSTGRQCRRGPTAYLPDGNVCPFCRYSPIYCAECGDRQVECPSCEKHIFVSRKKHGGADDPRWVAPSRPPNGQIINGCEWDGADFVGGFNQGFVTKRAVDWLIKTEARPFIAVPSRVDTSGMGEKQIAQLNAAAIPIS